MTAEQGRDDGAAAVPALDVVGLRVVHRRRGLVRAGPDFVAVEGADFRVLPGQIVGIVGESGSGKSSAANAIAMLHRPAAGSVRVNGQELTTVKPRELRRLRSEIQLIFQDPHGALDPRQSVGGGLRELRHVHGERTEWIDDDALLELVGLSPELISRLPHEISGGQAQRVCIARALLPRPRLLLADEPTSALDVSVQAQILTLIERLAAERGIGVLLITHDLSVVRAVCSYVHVMRSGQVVECGSTAAVLDRPQHEYTQSLLAAVPRFTPDAEMPGPEMPGPEMPGPEMEVPA